mgnify:FL=1
MDEEITIINSNTRNEKIYNFFISNRKILIVTVLTVFIILVGYFSLNAIKERNQIELANKFNLATIEFLYEKKKWNNQKIN